MPRNNMQIIINLVRNYYRMNAGEKIKNPEKLIALFHITDANHPHSGFTVWISRKALKHFVERRKAELCKRYTDEKALKYIYFIISHLNEVILKFDLYNFEPYFKHYYSKDYSMVGQPAIRVVLENIEGNLEIISIHLRKNKNAS